MWGGAGAAVATIVELVGLERVVVVESVGPGDELGARPHLTAAGKWGRDPVSPEPQEGAFTGGPTPHLTATEKWRDPVSTAGGGGGGGVIWGPTPHLTASSGRLARESVLITSSQILSLGDLGTFIPVLAFNLLVSIMCIYKLVGMVNLV